MRAGDPLPVARGIVAAVHQTEPGHGVVWFWFGRTGGLDTGVAHVPLSRLGTACHVRVVACVVDTEAGTVRQAVVTLPATRLNPRGGVAAGNEPAVHGFAGCVVASAIAEVEVREAVGR